jgi:hypothetical protein
MSSERSKGILYPPDGLTINEQARWWMSDAVMLQVGLTNKEISKEVMLAIKQVAKDNDLAYKIIDDKIVKGLTNEERGRLYFVLTVGGEWQGNDKSRPPETVRDLLLALSTQGIESPRELNTALRSVTGKYPTRKTKRGKPSNNISHYKKRLDDLLSRFAETNHEDLRRILEIATEENVKMSEKEIRLQLDLLEVCRQEDKNIT